LSPPAAGHRGDTTLEGEHTDPLITTRKHGRATAP
jgi:hypothetical protein